MADTVLEVRKPRSKKSIHHSAKTMSPFAICEPMAIVRS